MTMVMMSAQQTSELKLCHFYQNQNENGCDPPAIASNCIEYTYAHDI